MKTRILFNKKKSTNPSFARWDREPEDREGQRTGDLEENIKARAWERVS